MTHSRRPKKELPEWVDALNKAHVGEGPQPLCHERPEEYVDYGYPLPTARQAEELCIECPLYLLCRKAAKHKPPAWGIRGGLVYVQGRQVQLMARDDPRRSDPEFVAPEN